DYCRPTQAKTLLRAIEIERLELVFASKILLEHNSRLPQHRNVLPAEILPVPFAREIILHRWNKTFRDDEGVKQSTLDRDEVGAVGSSCHRDLLQYDRPQRWIQRCAKESIRYTVERMKIEPH